MDVLRRGFLVLLGDVFSGMGSFPQEDVKGTLKLKKNGERTVLNVMNNLNLAEVFIVACNLLGLHATRFAAKNINRRDFTAENLTTD